MAGPGLGFVTAAGAAATAAGDAEDELFDVVNLPRADTGVDGTIYLSTMQGQHGPRIKWFPGRPSRDGACLTVTLEATPRILNHGLPQRDVAAVSPALLGWVRSNRGELLRFWNDGLSWTRDEVDAFVEGLIKLG
jgi:hypothetical protein